MRINSSIQKLRRIFRRKPAQPFICGVAMQRIAAMQKENPEPSDTKVINTPTKFWIPKGVPEHLQIALSIPGDPPSSPSEHMSRLADLLAELARELEEWTEPGGALRAAQEFVPDSNLMMQPDDISPDTLACVLMNSDQLQTAAVFLAESGDYDEEYQDACREANFEERLAALVYVP